jgi:hypothetical protein
LPAVVVFPGPVEAELLVARAHEFGQLLVDDLDQLLTGRQAGQHLLAQRPLFDIGNELFDDPKVDIRFEERQAHLAQTFLDIALGQLAVALELLEDAVKLVGQVFKHTLAPIRLLSS